LKDIPELREYEPRHDPTVVPVVQGEQEVLSSEAAAASALRSKDTAYYTSADYHEMYKSGKLTPTDVAQYLLPLIQRESKTPGKYSVAFAQVRDNLVLEAANASTERYRQGKPLSPFDGVPIAVKDEVHLTGYQMRKGSKIDFTDSGDRTAWCVQKWIDAGALIIGKTIMHGMLSLLLVKTACADTIRNGTRHNQQ
jgi:Asp-tRNA(Asn)/Glu-tRNA(Gln) amidotransferase A subunit family amidase